MTERKAKVFRTVPEGTPISSRSVGKLRSRFAVVDNIKADPTEISEDEWAAAGSITRHQRHERGKTHRARGEA